MRLGYACINMTMGKKVSTNRAMIKKTFESKGLDYVSELALKNSQDIIKILEWNRLNGIYFFRLSSAVIPWGDHIDLTQLKDYKQIKAELKKAGDFAKYHNMRINSHPGPFCVLTSPNESVVTNTIADLELHGKIFDMMGLSKTTYNNINIHCNGVYGDKQSAMDRFITNFQRCSNSVKKRLTIENDDKGSMYSVKDLMYIHQKTGIPIVFDYHHHQFCTGDLSEEQALKLAATTWPKGIRQEVHYSESKRMHENNLKEKPQAHSDYIISLPNTYELDLDVMVEAKAKELALYIGRWQTWHNGHEWLISQQLDKGKNVWVAIRDVPQDEKNPKSAHQVLMDLSKEKFFIDNSDRIMISIIPDIESVNYGRGVGYEVINHIPPSNVEMISGTKIREGYMDSNGDVIEYSVNA